MTRRPHTLVGMLLHLAWTRRGLLALGGAIVVAVLTSWSTEAPIAVRTAPSFASDGSALVWSERVDDRNELRFARLSADGARAGEIVALGDERNRMRRPSIARARDRYGLVYECAPRKRPFRICFRAIALDGDSVDGRPLFPSHEGASERAAAIAQDGAGFAVGFERMSSSGWELRAARVSQDGAPRGEEESVALRGIVAPWSRAFSSSHHGDSTFAWTREGPSASGVVEAAEGRTRWTLARSERPISHVALARGEDAIALTWPIARSDYTTQVAAAVVRPGSEARPTIVSSDDVWAGEPSIAALAGEHGVVWSEAHGDDLDVYFRSLASNADVRAAPVRVASGREPVIAASSNGYLVAWSTNDFSAIHVARVERDGRVGTAHRVSE